MTKQENKDFALTLILRLATNISADKLTNKEILEVIKFLQNNV